MNKSAGNSPDGLIPLPEGYVDWLVDLKARIHSAQQRATLAVNRELVLLYWQIGRDILAHQAEEGWGAKVIDRLAHDLRTAFPDMKGFSPRNLKYMRAFAQAWPDETFVQQAVARLPWGHNLVLLDRLPGPETRKCYAAKAIEHNWSRNVLTMNRVKKFLIHSVRPELVEGFFDKLKERFDRLNVNGGLFISSLMRINRFVDMP